MKYVFIENTGRVQHQQCRVFRVARQRLVYVVSAADVRIKHASAVPPTLRQRCPAALPGQNSVTVPTAWRMNWRAQGYPFNVNRGGKLRRQGLRAKAGPEVQLRQSPRTRPACVRKSVEQDFTPVVSNQKWAGDITYFTHRWRLAVFWQWSLTCGHAVIGWSSSPRMTAQLACDALQMALAA